MSLLKDFKKFWDNYPVNQGPQDYQAKKKAKKRAKRTATGLLILGLGAGAFFLGRSIYNSMQDADKKSQEDAVVREADEEAQTSPDYMLTEDEWKSTLERISGLEDALDDLPDDSDVDVSQYMTQIDQLRDEVNNLYSSDDTINTNLDDINSMLSTHEQRFDGTDDRLSDLESEIEGLGDRLDDSLAEPNRYRINMVYANDKLSETYNLDSFENNELSVEELIDTVSTWEGFPVGQMRFVEYSSPNSPDGQMIVNFGNVEAEKNSTNLYFSKNDRRNEEQDTYQKVIIDHFRDNVPFGNTQMLLPMEETTKELLENKLSQGNAYLVASGEGFLDGDTDFYLVIGDRPDEDNFTRAGKYMYLD